MKLLLMLLLQFYHCRANNNNNIIIAADSWGFITTSEAETATISFGYNSTCATDIDADFLNLRRSLAGRPRPLTQRTSDRPSICPPTTAARYTGRVRSCINLRGRLSAPGTPNCSPFRLVTDYYFFPYGD
ncbi:uncharacterized protein G2W53_027850 [Senna tora]|uniref:Uncharacterized protein n=1 Tax=Senna tora TaxID=362788 RepID=A0A834WGE5_9FABA|nr:uncharacterized protein G2W53_027850 [Senna tora]